MLGNRSTIYSAAIIFLIVTIYSPVSAKELVVTNHLDINPWRNQLVYGQPIVTETAVYGNSVVWKKRRPI